MKEKRDCIIVQDLLPNYIEKLTNEETNNYIEEHLKECENCKNIFKNMQKDLKVNNAKRDKREVNYIKKFNQKFKLLRNILLIIVALFIIIVGRKTLILTSLSNKANEIVNEKNYYIKLESYSKGQMNILETYYKDEKALATMTIYSKESNVIKKTFYKSEKEVIGLIENGETKILTNNGDITIKPIAFTANNFLENLWIALTTSVDKIELNGKECYMIRDGNTEKFIDVKTGLAIKMIDNQNNRTVDYQYEYGVVEDTDIAKPDTTGYKLIQ